MIQIVALRTYVAENQTTKLTDKLINTGKDIPSVDDLFKNLPAILAAIPSESHWNLFYTVANSGPGKREFKSTSVIPFDIDGIDGARIADYTATICATLKLDADKCGLVSSGNGMHLLVQLPEPITDKGYFLKHRPHYKAVCKLLATALDGAGLPYKDVDASVFEHRRILRLPGTVNRKVDKPERPCVLVHGFGGPQALNLVELSGLPTLAKGEEVPSAVMKRYPNTDPKAVLDGCAFLQHCATNANAINEPQWYAALSVVARLEGQGSTGDERCHELSRGHRSYSRDVTDAKIEQALEASGPRTCASIQGLWDGCTACPHWQKVSSPILIRGEGSIRTEGTGFHDVLTDAKGVLKYVPNFEDLISFFAREHDYKVLGDSRQVYTWSTTHYVPVEKASLEAFAREHFNPKPTVKMMEEFRKRVEVANIIPVDWWENSLRRKMNFENGYLDIDTLAFRPHDKDMAFRTMLPYAYDAEAKAPTFSKMIAMVTDGDKEMTAVLEEFMGYALSNDSCWAQKALVLTGDGSNGKSTFLEVLAGLAGDDNYSTVNLAKVEEQYNMSQLDRKLFNISEETPPEALQKSHTFKNLVVGGRIVVRVPHKAPYHISNSAKLILTCNELPSSPDNTHGFYRRLLIVPFNQVFEKGQPDYDPHMVKKLKLELPGILNLALRGYRRALAQKGFTESKKIQDSLDEYRMENDSVLFWAKEHLIVHAEDSEHAAHFLSISDLYAAYRDAMKAMSIIPLNERRFCRRLRTLRGEVWGRYLYGQRTTKKYVRAGGKDVQVRGLAGVEVQQLS